jgi:hypothetical protein
MDKRSKGDKAIFGRRTREARRPVVRSVKTRRNLILEQARKHPSSEPACAISCVVPTSELGFGVGPALSWDEGSEFQH